jgi:hypothetical protein
MSDSNPVIPRGKMSAEERRVRSQLAQLIGQRGLIRGSLLVRRRVCGKPTCRCTRGASHESLYLVISQAARTRQVFVPKDWEPAVRRWVAEYHRARDLLEAISRLYWEQLRQRRS